MVYCTISTMKYTGLSDHCYTCPETGALTLVVSQIALVLKLKECFNYILLIKNSVKCNFR